MKLSDTAQPQNPLHIWIFHTRQDTVELLKKGNGALLAYLTGKSGYYSAVKGATHLDIHTKGVNDSILLNTKYTLELDVSSLTQAHYIAFAVNEENLRVHAVWLE